MTRGLREHEGIRFTSRSVTRVYIPIHLLYKGAFPQDFDLSPARLPQHSTHQDFWGTSTRSPRCRLRSAHSSGRWARTGFVWASSRRQARTVGKGFESKQQLSRQWFCHSWILPTAPSSSWRCFLSKREIHRETRTVQQQGTEGMCIFLLQKRTPENHRGTSELFSPRDGNSWLPPLLQLKEGEMVWRCKKQQHLEEGSRK